MKNLEVNKTVKFALLIEYDGNNLVGWQKQNEGVSVQGSLEEAANNIFNQELEIQGSGRTDAGVHALGQVAHINFPKNHRLTTKHPFYIISAFNSYLRKSNIRVVSTKQVEPEFNARFSATKRHYKYRILCRAAPPGIEKGKVWHSRKKLNIQLMEEGAKHLIGKHDFTSFRTINCQAKSPIRTLDKISLSCVGDEIIINVSAKSFLHSQVRIIVGTIYKVGDETLEPNNIKNILEGKDRNLAGPTAPSEGLYLEKVEYPSNLLDDKWPIIYDRNQYN